MNTVSQEGVSAPSIFAVEDSRMIYTVSITDNISDVFIYDEVLMLLENAEENDEIIFNISSIADFSVDTSVSLDGS